MDYSTSVDSKVGYSSRIAKCSINFRQHQQLSKILKEIGHVILLSSSVKHK